MKYLTIILLLAGTLFAQDSTATAPVDSTIYKFCIKGREAAGKQLQIVEKQIQDLQVIRERWTGIYLEYDAKAKEEKKKLDEQTEKNN